MPGRQRKNKVYAIAFFLCLGFILASLLPGCGSSADPESAPTMLLFGAASTQDALSEIVSEFNAETGVTVRSSFASSAALAQQIEAGADATIFVSASVEWTDYLEQHELITEKRQFLSNKLVLIVPSNSRLEIDSPDDLLQTGLHHIALADPTSVPAGQYAKEALISLGLWEEVEPKIAPGADVRQALFYVERGEAEAGIVYATDARLTDKVRVVAELDGALSTPVRYVVAIVAGHDEDSSVRQLYDYLNSEEAQSIFERFGFTTLQEND